MKNIQFALADSLHLVINQNKHMGVGWRLSMARWHAVADLMLLHVLGKCPSVAEAERLCGGRNGETRTFACILAGWMPEQGDLSKWIANKRRAGEMIFGVTDTEEFSSMPGTGTEA